MLPVPIFTLPKTPLLTPDLVDGSGNSVTLQTRPANTNHSLYLLISYLFAAITEFDISEFSPGFSLSKVQPVLEGLVFSMPQRLTTRHLGPANLGADSDAALMKTHLEDSGFRPTDRHKALIVQILEAGREVAARGWESGRQESSAANPLYNPLLIAGDYAKLARNRRVQHDLDIFLKECSYFLDMLTVFGDNIESELVREAFRRLATLTRSWTAISPLEVTLDQPSLVKLSSTIPLETQRRRRPFRPLIIGFSAFVGDCTSTHIEVRTPDQAGIRLLPNRTRLDFGDGQKERRVEKIFGHVHSGSRELQAFYTTKRAIDVRGAADDPASTTSEPPDDANRFAVNVRFRVQGWISVQYWIALAAGLLILGTAALARSTAGKEGVIAVAVAVTAGVLATRERDIAGRAVGYLRVVLIVVLLGLVAVLGVGLLSSSNPGSDATINLFPIHINEPDNSSDEATRRLVIDEHGWEGASKTRRERGSSLPPEGATVR